MKTESKALRISQITKAFDEKVLDGINLTVSSGEFVVLVGPNACGKTTLLRIIAGLLQSDYGEVYRENKANDGSSLSVVFQKPLLLPWLTLEENIYLPLRLKKNAAEHSEDLDRLLSLLDLENKRKSYPKGLSGGEAQKATIARALITDPKILLLDEPFSALDDIMRQELQDALLKIWLQTSDTVLFVTHDLDEAVLLADRVVVLSRKPTRVKQEVPITLGRPRHSNSPEFEALVLLVRRALLS
ncbi:MAG TPA: ABC transporter ATP-binding protein [Pyrinomonadaceae bacterium]|jgi:NitT/TauT family transport system ATP-binding protein|nr:ABC transporter ATP-binding protein [Pyrinomonadaceae bacterium]